MAARGIAAAVASKAKDKLLTIKNNLDIHAIQGVYQALLRVFDPELITALGNSSIKVKNAKGI